MLAEAKISDIELLIFPVGFYHTKAKRIIEILDKKNIEKFNLIGHSMGGMIVQEITKIVGDRVNKLICFATGSIGDIPGRFETMDETREKLKKEDQNP